METSWSNERWLAELQADSDVAWAALRGRIVRGVRAYLGGREPQGLDTPTLAPARAICRSSRRWMRGF